MDIYDKLGIKKLVDCAGTYTIIGGSRMSENTLRAMAEAAANHVMIRDLQKAIYPRIAELTHNEDAKVTAGAMAGGAAGSTMKGAGSAVKSLVK